MKVVRVVAMVAAVVAIAVLAVPTGGASVWLAGAIGVSTAVASAIITVGLTLAVSLAFKALGLTSAAPSTKVQATPTIIRQSLSDSYIIYGKRRTIYLKWVFFHSKKVGSTHVRYFVFAVAGHRCQGATDFMLNDEVVTLDGSNMVTTGPYADAVWLWFDRGEDTATANATFVSECGGKWTTDHRGKGIAKIYMKAEMTDAVVEAGFATPSAIVEGKDDILDPRDASTGYTANAALVFYDWMRLLREEGGFGIPAAEMPDDDWISAQANVCDEVVESEARYALDGIIVTGAAPSEIRDAMIINMAGTYTFSGGQHLARPGYWVPPSASLSESDLAAAIQVSAFISQGSAADQVLATYLDPASNYQPLPAAVQTASPPPADASQLDLDLGFVTSKYRAERIARIMLRRAQAEKTVVWPMNITGLAVKALDTVQLDTARYGLSNYAFSVGGWQLSADFGVILNLREENEEIYEDGTPVAPPSVDPIAVAEPVLTATDNSLLIINSGVTGLTLSAADVGASATITISAHSRVYPDKTEAVNSGSLTGKAFSTTYGIYYDDSGRAGGAVTYVATTTLADSINSITNPTRHHVGIITTPADGAAATGGGGPTPGGGSGSGSGAGGGGDTQPY